MGSADTVYKDSGGRLTKIPAIPAIPAGLSPEVKRFLAAMKENVEVREGKRGNDLDRSIVVRDLMDPDFTYKYWPDGGSENPNIAPGSEAPQTDTSPPGSPKDFALNEDGATANILTWVNPGDNDLSHIEIWVSDIDGIPPWTRFMSVDPTSSLRVRYAIDNVEKVYQVLSVGQGTFTDIPPDDPIHGFAGSGTDYWEQESYPYTEVARARLLGVLTKPTMEFTHTVDPDKDHYYWARAVDYAGNASEWTPDGYYEGLFAIAKVNDTPPATPTGLSVCGGSTSEFNDKDLHLCWSPASDTITKNYKVIIYDTATMTKRHEQSGIYGVRWPYSYSQNVSDGGGTPEDALTIRVWALNNYNTPSASYDEISVTNPVPANVSAVSAESWFSYVRFKWTGNTEPDILHYLYRSVIVEYGGTPGAGGEPDYSGDWIITTDPSAQIECNSAAKVIPEIYIQVKAVDTWGNESATPTVGNGVPGVPIPQANIDFFAQSLSESMPGIPVVTGDTWTDNSPSSGYVAWNQHLLWFRGKCYQVAASNTALKYIYWYTSAAKIAGLSGDGTVTSPYIDAYEKSDTNPANSYDTTPYVENFTIAVNISGYHDLAWNAIANQAIGSAYIQDLAVTNAKILSLDAGKITTGVIESTNWDTTHGSQFHMDDGELLIGGSDDPMFHFSQIAGTLKIKGALVVSAGATEFPMPCYMGAYNPSTTYYQGDVVTYGGSSWMYVYATGASGQTPAENAYWDLYASEGDTGATGAKGDTGDTGADGRGVVYQGEWASGTYYYGTAYRRDIVKYSGAYYICTSSLTSSTVPSSDPSHWSSFGATFDSVATDLLFANYVTINEGIVLASDAFVRTDGKTDYGSGDGIFIGKSGGAWKLDIGKGSTTSPNKSLKWNGSALAIYGDLISTSNINANAVTHGLGGTVGSTVIGIGVEVLLITLSSLVVASGDSGVFLSAYATGQDTATGAWVSVGFSFYEAPGAATYTYYLKLDATVTAQPILKMYRATTLIATCRVQKAAISFILQASFWALSAKR